MKFVNHIPIYIQIINQLKREIVLGHIMPGDKLESVREYAIEMKVNPNTVQKAYQEMERDGLAFSKRGIGRFIIDEEGLVARLMHEMSTEIVGAYILKMQEIGYGHKEIRERLEQTLNGG
jgi:GntR family transcriptional regulator